MMNNTKLEPCPSRVLRCYDGRDVMACGYRELDVEECLECQNERERKRNCPGGSTDVWISPSGRSYYRIY